MKTSQLLCVVVLALVGCNEPSSTPIPKSVYMSKPVMVQRAPNLGRSIVLGTVDDVNNFTIEVVLYETLGVVCIQHRSLQYSRNCWDVDTAPKKMQELVKEYMEMKYVPIQ